MRTLALPAAALAALLCAHAARSAAPRAGPPLRLSDTGLYADPAARTLAPGVLPFSPQYPLWTDGAGKRRWIALPKGASIDASDARAWRFPVGTKLWKEFSFGRRVETRFMHLGRRGWSFAAYVWDEDGRDARLAPAGGVRGAHVDAARGVRHDVPGVEDCKACHEAGPSPVLGFTLLQLSPDRDPLAPNAAAPEAGSVDLASLAARGLVRRLDPRHLEAPPRVAARTPRERAALGYLAANCAGCHNASGPLASVGLSLEAPLAGAPPAAPGARETAIGVEGRWRRPGAQGAALRVAPGEPEASTLLQRMSTRHAAAQMPPLGTSAVDEAAVRVVREWIRELPAPSVARGARHP